MVSMKTIDTDNTTTSAISSSEDPTSQAQKVEAHIGHKLDMGATLTHSGTDQELDSNRQWTSEKETLWSLLYFNLLLIIYNAVFVLYSILLIMEAQYTSMVLFLQLSGLLHFFIMSNFTLRYYRLARAMRIFFTSDYRKQLKLLQPRSIRCHNTTVFIVLISLYVFAIASSITLIIGCIDIIKGEHHYPRQQEKIERGQSYIKAALVFSVIINTVLAAI